MASQNSSDSDDLTNYQQFKVPNLKEIQSKKKDGSNKYLMKYLQNESQNMKSLLAYQNTTKKGIKPDKSRNIHPYSQSLYHSQSQIKPPTSRTTTLYQADNSLNYSTADLYSNSKFLPTCNPLSNTKLPGKHIHLKQYNTYARTNKVNEKLTNIAKHNQNII